MHLKYKCSWSDDVIRSKFVKAPHQKHFKGCSNNLITPKHCKRLKECNNNLWDEIWMHWMLVLSRALTKDNCTNCTTTSSTTLFVSLQQDKDNSSTCRNVPSYKECIWNWSFIGQQPYQAIDHWLLSTSFKQLFFLCWQSSNVCFTPLYKGVKTC